MDTRIRIGIIGSGIAGASAAHFLRDALGHDVEIVVFERTRQIGGRTSHIGGDGTVMETGAVYSVAYGRYMLDFVRRLHLGVDTLTPWESSRLRDVGNVEVAPAQLGSWDGRKLTSVNPPSTWSGKARGFLHYGFGAARLPGLAGEFVDGFNQLYRLQDAGYSAASPESLLRAVELYHLTQQTTSEFYADRKISSRFMREVAGGMGRVCYGEGESLNAFANLLLLAGATALRGRVFTVREGNREVARGLLRVANARLRLGVNVVTIRESHGMANSPPVSVVTEGSKAPEAFHAVIMAAPIETASVRLLDTARPGPAVPHREFKTVHVTHVRGRLDARRFRKRRAEEIPTVVVTPEGSSAGFWGIRIVRWAPGPDAIYAIYSENEPTEALLSRLFSSHAVVHHVRHEAFPLLKPVRAWQPFVLGPRVYYVNALESAASCMEVQAIASRNVVNALVRDIRPRATAGSSTLR